MHEELKRKAYHGSGKIGRALWIPLILTGICITLTAAKSENPVDLKEFGGITILHEGRKKPLDTYARGLLLQLSGKSRYQDMTALRWLARLWFTPEKTGNDKVFMVNDMQAIEAMGLEREESRKFSYNELKAGLNKLWELADEIEKIDSKARSVVEKEIFSLAHKLNTYLNMANSFQFAIPYAIFGVQSDTLTRIMGLENRSTKHSFLEIFNQYPQLAHFLETAQKDSLVNPAAREEAQNIAKTLSQWLQHYQSSPVNLLPVSLGENETWLSPWKMFSAPEFRENREQMNRLGAFTLAYLNQDNAAFQNTVMNFNDLVELKLAGYFNTKKIALELLYNKSDPFMWSKTLYGLGLVLSLILLGLRSKWLYRAAVLVISLGLLYHTGGMILRMFIMGRPPVTNLFETFIFVGWMSALLGVVVEWFNKNGLGFIIGSLSALAMLMISQKYALEGDTMGMLVAVLDSNFWLATHVITISMGYAGCCAAGVAGHVYLIQELVNSDKEKIKETGKMIYGMLAFGLIFTFAGTVLGGIWADQSWGRFWGWDPKENGALLIILWCSIVFHARIDGLIRGLGVAVGSVIGIIVVMFAWFGVNLLGVGLHSYGFSTGIAFKLLIFVIAECAFLIFVLGWILQKRKMITR